MPSSSCPICYSEELVFFLECLHPLCEICARRLKEKICPLCRYEIKKEYIPFPRHNSLVCNSKSKIGERIIVRVKRRRKGKKKGRNFDVINYNNQTIITEYRERRKNDDQDKRISEERRKRELNKRLEKEKRENIRKGKYGIYRYHTEMRIR